MAKNRECRNGNMENVEKIEACKNLENDCIGNEG